MISVCIATYNGEKFLKLQLLSILNQISPKDEVIISDDGSTDNTLQIINDFNDPRIKLYHHKRKIIFKKSPIKNMNLASQNFGYALSKCKGDIIFLADQDDIWKQNKVKRCVLELKNCDLVYHNFSEIDEFQNMLNEFHFQNEIPIKSTLLRNYLRMPFAGCCMAFKKEVLNSILPFNKKTITHDQQIGFSALIHGKTKYLNDSLIKRRFHSSNFSLYNKREKLNYKLIYLFQVYWTNLIFLFNESFTSSRRRL